MTVVHTCALPIWWRARLYGASTTQPAGTFAGAGTRRAVLIVTCGSSICPTITPSPAVGEIGALKLTSDTAAPTTISPNTAQPAPSQPGAPASNTLMSASNQTDRAAWRERVGHDE